MFILCGLTLCLRTLVGNAPAKGERHSAALLLGLVGGDTTTSHLPSRQMYTGCTSSPERGKTSSLGLDSDQIHLFDSPSRLIWLLTSPRPKAIAARSSVRTSPPSPAATGYWLVINRNHPHLTLLPFSPYPSTPHSYRTLPRSSSAARCRTITVYLKSSTRPRSGITDGPLSSFSSGSSSRPSVSCILPAHIAIAFADACMPLS